MTLLYQFQGNIIVYGTDFWEQETTIHNFIETNYDKVDVQMNQFE